MSLIRRTAAFFAAALFATVAVFGTSGVAAAATTETTWYVSYGNSLTRGTITWYNRSLTFEGWVRSASGCKALWVRATGGGINYQEYVTFEDGTRLSCVGDGDLKFSRIFDGFDIPGGPQRAEVALTASVGSPALTRDVCDRSACQDG